VVALSTAESEYIAGATAAKDAVWVGRVATDLQLVSEPTVKLYCDNESAIHIANNPSDTSRTKHIDLRYHYLRQCVQDGSIEPTYVNTDDNAADLFTKALPRLKFLKFCDMIGIA
jgi:hypothetical protein